MMVGVVNARREAVVRLRLRGPDGAEADVDTIVDTGFTASLTLPTTIVDTLGLPRKSGSSAVLADGSVCPFDLCDAEVAWNDTWRHVLVSALGTEPLMGMGLLAGHELMIEVEPGGVVEIVPLA